MAVTTVAAPAQPPDDDLFAYIDNLRFTELIDLLGVLRVRYGIVFEARFTISRDPAVCAGSTVLEDHDLVREWFTPNLNSITGRMLGEAPERYFVGAQCTRCRWKTPITSSWKVVLAASHD